jgi:hypothetical protein
VEGGDVAKWLMYGEEARFAPISAECFGRNPAREIAEPEAAIAGNSSRARVWAVAVGQYPWSEPQTGRDTGRGEAGQLRERNKQSMVRRVVGPRARGDRPVLSRMGEVMDTAGSSRDAPHESVWPEGSVGARAEEPPRGAGGCASGGAVRPGRRSGRRGAGIDWLEPEASPSEAAWPGRASCAICPLRWGGLGLREPSSHAFHRVGGGSLCFLAGYTSGSRGAVPAVGCASDSRDRRAIRQPGLRPRIAGSPHLRR